MSFLSANDAKKMLFIFGVSGFNPKLLTFRFYLSAYSLKMIRLICKFIKKIFNTI